MRLVEKLAVILRNALPGHNCLREMTLPNRSHPEQSGGGKAGAAESKDPVELTRDVDREVHGILRLRSGRYTPFTPLRMTAIRKADMHHSSFPVPHFEPDGLIRPGFLFHHHEAARSHLLHQFLIHVLLHDPTA